MADPTRESSVDQYVEEISRYPLLSKEEELDLSRRKQRDNDMRAAHLLVMSNLRFVLKIAHEYKGYGLKLADLVQEGNIGLMKAVQRFDPDRGNRLISYAVWWIRAYIQNHIISAWSLVKIGTTQAQRRLFFKIRSEINRARQSAPAEDAKDITKDLAARLKVKETEVRDMEHRLAGRDFSLNSKKGWGTDSTFLDWLKEPEPSPENQLTQTERTGVIRGTVDDIMGSFTEREQYIVRHRLMENEAPETLQKIGDHFDISRERARQIELGVKDKLRMALKDNGIHRAAA